MLYRIYSNFICTDSCAPHDNDVVEHITSGKIWKCKFFDSVDSTSNLYFSFNIANQRWWFPLPAAMPPKCCSNENLSFKLSWSMANFLVISLWFLFSDQRRDSARPRRPSTSYDVVRLRNYVVLIKQMGRGDIFI